MKAVVLSSPMKMHIHSEFSIQLLGLPGNLKTYHNFLEPRLNSFAL